MKLPVDTRADSCIPNEIQGAFQNGSRARYLGQSKAASPYLTKANVPSIGCEYLHDVWIMGWEKEDGR